MNSYFKKATHSGWLLKNSVLAGYFGILCSSKKREIIPELQQILGKPEIHLQPIEITHRICPVCRKGTMRTVMMFSGRGPPAEELHRFIAG